MVKRGLTSNQLKLIAIAAMLFDHAVFAVVPHGTLFFSLLRIPGRITAPIMCYMIAEGYRYTSNRKRYIARLLTFAVISHLPYNLYFGYKFFEATSVMWCLAMGLVALTAVKSERLHIAVKLAVLAAACVLSVTADWNYIAVLWIVAFGVFCGEYAKQMISFCVIGAVFYILPAYLRSLSSGGNFYFYQLGIVLAVPLLFLYNGKRGARSAAITWMFYVFYPAHLVILYLLRLLLSR